MQHILTVFLPAALVFCMFRLGGMQLGLLTLCVYLIVAIFIKLPDILMIQGAKAYKKNPEKGLAYMEKAFRTKRLRTEYILYYGLSVSRQEGWRMLSECWTRPPIRK